LINTPHAQASGNAAPAALYQRVKAHVAELVRSGEWKPGQRIPSEHMLVAQLGVSRMTVNRALRELAAEGLLLRIGGVGTFIAEPKPQSALLKIADIAAEIKGRAHRYALKIVQHGSEPASAPVAGALNLHVGDPVYHLTCVHTEDGDPVQIEDRYVNPRAAPRFIEQRFKDVSPAQWLLNAVPLTEIEHIVEALKPSVAEAVLLQLARTEPCLVLIRRTWSNTLPVTYARFVHPGSRYRLGGRYIVKSGALIG
jgi:GntR family histidine utilization transcriptional repressor